MPVLRNALVGLLLACNKEMRWKVEVGGGKALQKRLESWGRGRGMTGLKKEV